MDMIPQREPRRAASYWAAGSLLNLKRFHPCETCGLLAVDTGLRIVRPRNGFHNQMLRSKDITSDGAGDGGKRLELMAVPPVIGKPIFQVSWKML
jgi:hypothetical protein